MAETRDMLVAAPERWDETCFLVPAVRALMAAGFHAGVICAEDRREFWETLPGLEIIPFTAKTRAKALAAELGGGWQASLVWESGTAAEASALAGIPRRLGPALKPLVRWLTHPLEAAPGPLEHRVRFFLGLIEAMGIRTLDASFFAPAETGIEPDAAAVLLSPDSDFGASYEWPLDRWRELAGALRDDGLRLTVAGLDGGRGLARRLADSLDGVELFHASPLAGTLPLLAVHRVVVAADGSLPHVAAHAGTTCVTLFGPGDPVWKRPLGRRHAVVRRHVECAPCLLAKCPLDARCQNELETARVLDAVAAALR